MRWHPLCEVIEQCTLLIRPVLEKLGHQTFCYPPLVTRRCFLSEVLANQRIRFSMGKVELLGAPKGPADCITDERGLRIRKMHFPTRQIGFAPLVVSREEVLPAGGASRGRIHHLDSLDTDSIFQRREGRIHRIDDRVVQLIPHPGQEVPRLECVQHSELVPARHGEGRKDPRTIVVIDHQFTATSPGIRSGGDSMGAQELDTVALTEGAVRHQVHRVAEPFERDPIEIAFDEVDGPLPVQQPENTPFIIEPGVHPALPVSPRLMGRVPLCAPAPPGNTRSDARLSDTGREVFRVRHDVSVLSGPDWLPSHTLLVRRMTRNGPFRPFRESLEVPPETSRGRGGAMNLTGAQGFPSRNHSGWRIRKSIALDCPLMRLKTGVEAALHACVVMHWRDGRPVTGEELAALYGLPPAQLHKTLRSLVTMRLVSASRGHHGGYALRVPGEALRVSRVVQAVDGDLPFFECSEVRRCGLAGMSAPDRAEVCRLHKLMSEAERQYWATLGDTVAKVAQVMGPQLRDATLRTLDAHS